MQLPRSLAIRAVRRFSAGVAEFAREAERVTETAALKLELISSVAGQKLHGLDTVAGQLKKGQCTTEQLLEGIKGGHLTHGDLLSLEQGGTLGASTLHWIRTQVCGGSYRLSMTEILSLFKDGLMGKEEMVSLVKRGDINQRDVEELVRRDVLPKEVADSIQEDVKEATEEVDTKEERRGYTEIKEMLASKQLPESGLAHFVLAGDLHPDDVALLVTEDDLSKEAAEMVIAASATSVAEAYEEIEKFAELVSEERFTFEELEVMRAKGVLGDYLVHHLVRRGAVDDVQGQRLLKIEADKDYLDPEETDEEMEATPATRVDTMSEESRQSMMDADEATAASTESSVLERGGASDEGFYPENIDKNDVFSLWEYLFELYDNRPGIDASPLTQDDGSRLKHLSGAVLRRQDLRKRLEIAPLDVKGQATTEGKRKSAIASVTLRKGHGDIVINDRPFREYFLNMDGRCYVLSPFLATETLGTYDADVTVEGGGWSGQAQAIRHGIAKALIQHDPEMQEKLTALGLLTRDARRVERKKPGRAKARKSFQWVKR